MPLDPFVVHIARLRRQPGTRWPELRVGPFDPDGTLAPSSPVDSAVPAGADAACDVVLQSFPGGVMATGTVRAPWRGVCRRCAVAIDGQLEVSFMERFVEGGGGHRGAGDRDGVGAGDGVRDWNRDDEAYPITGDQLDLGPLVRELLVLELPLAPVCRPDCAGLCPHCGADRNEGPCSCLAPRDPRWASLDVLRAGSGEGRAAEPAHERP